MLPCPSEGEWQARSLCPLWVPAFLCIPGALTPADITIVLWLNSWSDLPTSSHISNSCLHCILKGLSPKTSLTLWFLFALSTNGIATFKTQVPKPAFLSLKCPALCTSQSKSCAHPHTLVCPLAVQSFFYSLRLSIVSFKAFSCPGPLFPELLRHRCDFPLFFCVVLLISLFINCKRGCFYSLPCSLPETKDKATTIIMMFESQHPVYNWSMGSLSVFLLNRWKKLGADPVSGKIRVFSLRNICFRNPTAIYRLGARCRVRAELFFIYLFFCEASLFFPT